MKFYDITLPLSKDVPLWPGDVPFKKVDSKSKALKSVLTFSSHFGTHVDAPKHFIFNSKETVDRLPPHNLIGVYKVFAIKNLQEITVGELKKFDIQKGNRVLFKTRNSRLVMHKKFDDSYVYLTLDAAEYLAKKKILLVGMDYPGLAKRGGDSTPVHRTLFKAGVVIAEGLFLKDVKPGQYDGAILPLKIKSGDGSPARAILWRH